LAQFVFARKHPALACRLPLLFGRLTPRRGIVPRAPLEMGNAACCDSAQKSMIVEKAAMPEVPVLFKDSFTTTIEPTVNDTKPAPAPAIVEKATMSEVPVLTEDSSTTTIEPKVNDTKQAPAPAIVEKATMPEVPVLIEDSSTTTIEPPVNDTKPAPAPASVVAEVPTAAVQAMPSDTMTLRFKTINQDFVDKVWSSRPLGLDYPNNMSPIVIQTVKPDRNGEALGVQSGWTVMAVNGEDVAGKSFEYIDGLMRKCAGALKQLEKA